MVNLKNKTGTATWFKYKLALIRMQKGETREEAWARHLRERPQDFRAKIRIFNLAGGGDRKPQSPCGGFLNNEEA